jgi:hypothetical protein
MWGPLIFLQQSALPIVEIARSRQLGYTNYMSVLLLMLLYIDFQILSYVFASWMIHANDFTLRHNRFICKVPQKERGMNEEVWSPFERLF